MRRFLEIPRLSKGKGWTERFVNIDRIDSLFIDKSGRDYTVAVSVGAKTHYLLETKDEDKAREKYVEVLNLIRRAK